MDTLKRDCLLYYASGRSARVSSRALLPEPLRPSPCKSRLAFAFSLEEHAALVRSGGQYSAGTSASSFVYGLPCLLVRNLIYNLSLNAKKGQEKQVSSRQL